MRPTAGRQQAHVTKAVSEVPKTHPGLHKENAGQRTVGTCGWAVKVRLIVVLGAITWGLAGVRTVVTA